ncbi:MAG: type IV pilin protein [Chromatiales bacterium]|jgi:type IV pilus assembly protein PilE|nr:type IV pilin protein [Chromatiales bacterium]
MSGMSLIEVLTVMAILAILAAIAWPSYTDVLRKGRRMDAITALQRVQLDQERYRAVHHRYAQRLSDLGWLADEVDSSEGYYRIRLQEVADARVDYRVRAEPKSGTDQINDACGAFALGAQGADPDAPADAACWLH